MGQTYFITGACGGLGSAVTTELMNRGARVFASDIDDRGLSQLPRSAAVSRLHLDVSDAASVRQAREKIAAATDSLDGIVCAAGIYAGGPLLEASDEAVRRAVDVNVIGVVTVVRELFSLLREGSRIVLVSSESTRVAVPFTGPYVMSKCALEAYADTLRRELLPFGIRVTVVQPGAIRTHLLETAAESLAATPRNPVYRRGLGRAAAVLQKTAGSGMEAARVAKVIAGAFQSRRPLRRIRIGNDAARALLSYLPSPLIDFLVGRFL